MPKKLTEEEKAERKAKRDAEKAAKAEENKSEEVSLEDALAEEGKTTGDIGSKKADKPEGKKAEPKTPKTPLEKGYPGEGTKTRKAWDTFDKLLIENTAVSRKDIIAHCISKGMAPGMVSSQYADWRKYHIAAGNWQAVEDARAKAKAEAEAKAKAEKASAKEAKQAEKNSEQK